MTPREIYWVELPPAGGREQSGRRPTIILQDDAYASRLPLVLVVPITSSLAAARFAGTLRLNATPTNGLSKDSVALVFQMRAIDRQRVRDRIGAIEARELEQLDEVLDRLTGRRSIS